MKNFENIIQFIILVLSDPGDLLNIPTKSDGTADMRFVESKEAVNMGIINPGQPIQ